MTSSFLQPARSGALALTLLASLLARPASAAPEEAPRPESLAALPLEQLMAMRTVSAASKFEQLISEAPSAVVVLTAADIKAFGWRTLADALASLPGVYATNDRNYSYLGARGFLRPGDYNSRFLLLVDGARTNDAVYGQVSIGYEGLLDMDMVQRIEYVPGPGSAVYGSNALFGVINVITKDGSALGGAQAALTVGSHGERKLRASWGWHGQNGADLVLSATSYSRDGADLYFPEYDTPEQNSGVAEGHDYERARNFLIRASYGGFTLSASHVHRTKGVPTATFGAVFNTPNWTRDPQSLVSLSYKRDLAPDLSLSAQALWGKADYLASGVYPGDYYGYFPGVPATVTNIDGDHARWYSANVQATITRLRGHKIVLGADIGRDARRDQFNYVPEPYYLLLDDRRPAKHAGLYLEDEIRFSSSVLLNLGLRHDRHSTGTHSTSPRAALLYKISPADTVKLIYGTAFREPNAYETYYAYYEPEETDAQDAQPALAPERIQTYEAVLEHALGSAGHATLSVFRYNIRGLISQEVDDAGYLVFGNVARARATGAEAALERLLGGGGARVRASYAWQRAQDGAGQALVNSPRHLAKLNLVVPVWTGARLGSEVQCTSARLTGQGSTGGYCLANLTLVSNAVLPGADLSITLANATNKRYEDAAGLEFVRGAVARDGRTLRAKLSYQF